MRYDIVIGGTMVSSIVPAVFVALLLTWLLSLVLIEIGFYRIVWQRPIVELALFCILLGAVVASFAAT